MREREKQVTEEQDRRKGNENYNREFVSLRALSPTSVLARRPARPHELDPFHSPFPLPGDGASALRPPISLANVLRDTDNPFKQSDDNLINSHRFGNPAGLAFLNAPRASLSWWSAGRGTGEREWERGEGVERSDVD